MTTTTQINASWFEHGGFRFAAKAQPLWGTRPGPDATPAQRQAFDLAASMGMAPEVSASAGVERYVRGWRVSVRAETTRRWSEIDTDAWPSETHVSLTGDEATLVCHAALEVPAGTDLLKAVAERFRLEGPVGEEAAAAFIEGSLQPEQLAGAARVAAVAGTALFLAGCAATGWAARVGSWARLGVAVGLLVATGVLLALLGGVEHQEGTVEDLEAWRRARSFRGG